MIPLDETGAQLLFWFVATAYERRALGIGSRWPFDQWGRFLPEHTTAVNLLDRLLHHGIVVVTEGESGSGTDDSPLGRGWGRRSPACARTDES